MIEAHTTCSPARRRAAIHYPPRFQQRRRRSFTSIGIVVVVPFCWCLLVASFFYRVKALAPSSPSSGVVISTTATVVPPPPLTTTVLTVRIPEEIWRKAASDHRAEIKTLLLPGLVDYKTHPMMASLRKKFRSMDKDDEHGTAWMTMLDPKHPVYNFLVEYYGLKGLKGPKRLARWSPSIGLFFFDGCGKITTKTIGRTVRDSDINVNNDDMNSKTKATTRTTTNVVRRIESLDEYYRASTAYQSEHIHTHIQRQLQTRPILEKCECADRSIFLEGATPDDFGTTLHLKGAEWIDTDYITTKNSNENNNSDNDNDCTESNDSIYGGMSGVLYRLRIRGDDDNVESTATSITKKQKQATGLLWYQSVLEATLRNDPVLHCYGLHEWAMQYHPKGAPPPPSGKYQSHTQLRVSRETINQTVERKGLRCTHVDALRFFAPAAAPLNKQGSSLQRTDQLRLEQPGCVHAHMDLFKIALKITPFVDPCLLREILRIALKARTLDVGASPYDCSEYVIGNMDNIHDGDGDLIPIPVIPVETSEGRTLYMERQKELMAEAYSIRQNLLFNYKAVLRLQFTDRHLQEARDNPSDERFAKAEPGGLPWRKNLVDRPSVSSSPEQVAAAATAPAPATSIP
mmetsp:Transcript_23139/g.48509  ORF Transcript_23139/g.48509 Transcript_23139/m.48509 type:complete len:630 (-) Transcript_23139:164-2053(-)